jgi:hypothetical protein
LAVVHNPFVTRGEWTALGHDSPIDRMTQKSKIGGLEGKMVRNSLRRPREPFSLHGKNGLMPLGLTTTDQFVSKIGKQVA